MMIHDIKLGTVHLPPEALQDRPFLSIVRRKLSTGLKKGTQDIAR